MYTPYVEHFKYVTTLFANYISIKLERKRYRLQVPGIRFCISLWVHFQPIAMTMGFSFSLAGFTGGRPVIQWELQVELETGVTMVGDMGSGSPARAAHSCSLCCPGSYTLLILGGLSQDSINIRDTAGFEFPGMTLFNKTIPVAGARCHSTSSVHCIVCSPPQVRLPSIDHWPCAKCCVLSHVLSWTH